jgi:hypothetical protein
MNSSQEHCTTVYTTSIRMRVHCPPMEARMTTANGLASTIIYLQRNRESFVDKHQMFREVVMFRSPNTASSYDHMWESGMWHVAHQRDSRSTS